MKNKNTRFILREQQNDFLFKKSKSNLNIRFNRIGFIFFIFFILFLIFSIHLIHLGSRNSKIGIDNKIRKPLNKLYRADIVDRNGDYLVKTVSSIDIGISSQKVIDKKKLIINLKYIFPNKDYDKIESKLNDKNFFYFEKKISDQNYEKITDL